ncbi:IPT/TIG domain-containing protein [Candidatus Leptofilum sp.]|uniref:IPT/TIG domain-containing protein n=1 Tax=Candidatus Leptofilum sp. TaxID=3241576 RepID=UPI003B5A46F0
MLPRLVAAAPASEPIAVRNGSFGLQVTPTATITPTTTSTPTPTNTATPLPPTTAPIILTAIEPGRISAETGGTLTVYGNNFTAGSVIRVVGYGVLQTTYVNNEVLTGIIPPGLNLGKYNVQVGLGAQDGPNAVLEGVLEIFGPTPTPVPTNTPVPSPTTGFVFGQPQIAIRSALTSPTSLTPGEPFELTLELANLGNWTAIDIELELQSADLAIPAAGSSVQILPRIGVNEIVTTTLSLIVRENAPNGPQNLGFNIDFFDLDGRPYNTQPGVGLNIGQGATATPTRGPAEPRLVLTTYEVAPANLQPGTRFDLKLLLSNVGDEAAEDVLLTLGGSGGAQLTPFALVNSGNVRFIEELAADEVTEVVVTMLVDGTAASGVYNLPIEFSYGNSDRTDAQVVNLLVEKAPQLQVGFYRSTGPGFVGQPLDLPVEVVNIGRSLINVSTLSLSSPGGTVENNSIYIGPLDGGTSGSLDGLIFPEEGGPLEVLVTVNYLDDFNQPQIFEQTLTVPVDAPDEPPQFTEDGEVIVVDGDTAVPSDEDESFGQLLWRFIRGMLGLGS